MTIYFDNAATTRPYDEVIEAVANYERQLYANPSSLHKFGFEASKVADDTAQKVLKVLALQGKYKVVFTSGATESANLAIKGTLEKYDDISKAHIITSTFEHPCVSEAVKYCMKKGAQASFINIDRFGIIKQDELTEAIKPNTKLASFIWVNNETGAVQPAAEIIRRIKKENPEVLVHVDATQGFGKIDDPLTDADMITISAHKFHGPKGVGALIIKDNLTFVPLLHGGGQQMGIRSGTLNAPAIKGMGKACEILLAQNPKIKIKSLQIYLYERLSKMFGIDAINTKLKESSYAPHILSISFPGIKSEVILHMLEQHEIFVSSGSACSSHKKHTSVLSAIGLNDRATQGTIRISLSEFNTTDEIDFFAEKLKNIIERLKGNIHE